MGHGDVGVLVVLQDFRRDIEIGVVAEGQETGQRLQLGIADGLALLTHDEFGEFVGVRLDDVRGGV